MKWVQKRPKKAKRAAFKLIFISEKTKIANLKRHVCQNAIGMAT